MAKFTIIGIDQGLASCGYGVIRFKKTKKSIKIDKVLDYGVIKTTSKQETKDRLVYIHNKLTELVDTYKPIGISCERLFYSAPSKGQRKKSASIITTNMVTGLVILTAGENNLEFADFVPSSVKKEITGNGKATKEDMISTIPKILGIEEGVVKIEHQADALSIAYTFGMRINKNKEENEEEEVNG